MQPIGQGQFHADWIGGVEGEAIIVLESPDFFGEKKDFFQAHFTRTPIFRLGQKVRPGCQKGHDLLVAGLGNMAQDFFDHQNILRVIHGHAQVGPCGLRALEMYLEQFGILKQIGGADRMLAGRKIAGRHPVQCRHGENLSAQAVNDAVVVAVQAEVGAFFQMGVDQQVQGLDVNKREIPVYSDDMVGLFQMAHLS